MQLLLLSHLFSLNSMNCQCLYLLVIESNHLSGCVCSFCCATLWQEWCTALWTSRGKTTSASSQYWSSNRPMDLNQILLLDFQDPVSNIERFCNGKTGACHNGNMLCGLTHALQKWLCTNSFIYGHFWFCETPKQKLFICVYVAWYTVRTNVQGIIYLFVNQQFPTLYTNKSSKQKIFVYRNVSWNMNFSLQYHSHHMLENICDGNEACKYAILNIYKVGL